jgi:hypothetical protein
MLLKTTTYRSLTGKKEIVRIQERKDAQFIVYKNKKAAYFVDCVILKSESNRTSNNLILKQRSPIDQVLKKYIKKNEGNLTVETRPLSSIKVEAKTKKKLLKPIPLEWLN